MTIRCYYDSKWANAFRRKKAEDFLLSEHNFLHCQNQSSQQVYISRRLHGFFSLCIIVFKRCVSLLHWPEGASVLKWPFSVFVFFS